MSTVHTASRPIRMCVCGHNEIAHIDTGGADVDNCIDCDCLVFKEALPDETSHERTAP